MPLATIENIEYNAVSKLIRDLKNYCLKEGLPMFCSVYVPQKKEYINDIVSPYALGMELNPDSITEHLNVSNGFHTVPPKEALMEYDADGLRIDDEQDETLLALNECLSDSENCEEDQ